MVGDLRRADRTDGEALGGIVHSMLITLLLTSRVFDSAPAGSVHRIKYHLQRQPLKHGLPVTTSCTDKVQP